MPSPNRARHCRAILNSRVELARDYLAFTMISSTELRVCSSTHQLHRAQVDSSRPVQDWRPVQPNLAEMVCRDNISRTASRIIAVQVEVD